MNSSLTHVVDYIIEKEPLVNKFISVPKDKGLYTSNKLTALSHGVTYTVATLPINITTK